MKRTTKEKYIFITQKELKTFRLRQFKLQGRWCPILEQQIRFKDSVVDHKHKRKEEQYGGPEGKGLIRGILHFQANVMEGKIVRLYKRYGLSKFIGLPTLLRNIASYIEQPVSRPYYVHPSAIPKVKKQTLKKVDSNRVFKYWKMIHPRRKLPTLSASGKVTKEWAIYVQEAKEYHEQKTGVKLKSA